MAPLPALTNDASVANKRNFRYSHYIGDPLFPSMLYYRQTELEPYGPKLTYEDAASHIFFDSTCRQVTTDKGFRMARANVGVREGRWYWECKVKQGIRKAKDGDSKSQTSNHVRMGWARREASLEAPVGYDAYSYGIRDVTGEKVWMSRPKDFFPPGETIHEGDVIGLEIQLPSERLHRRVMAGTYNPAVDPHEELQPKRTASAANIVRERPAIRHKANNYFENIDYSSTKELEDLMNPSPLGPSGAMEAPNPLHASPSLRTLPKSSIRLYKNGKLMGTAFEDLLGFLPPASKQQQGARDGLDDGSLGYYPAVSVFRGGAAEVNFGPDFWYPPPGYKSTNGNMEMVSNGETGGVARPLSERFEEQIAEDVVWDIVDEVDFWMQDGQGPPGSGGMASGSAKAGLTHGRGIAQDD
ncbi:concanavalin A-like lectin/glucanase domain-containing protein [Emericellopsis atlantica]|uniref:Concanavalin A-like lectin/glucanase domain-containing protein n=1 Tax=Emericellopsis atlantica TaxID=2614577 RepID=A0A9P8CS15_9HYPO|nr:concanavalin A-like lectin/glucanase domain-containing protein [Emericellopsis atlantica]KAG9257353.1 concanavalin A-like lectin/glucanase domain-containing protein [Emericellopsis atlantica]